MIPGWQWVLLRNHMGCHLYRLIEGIVGDDWNRGLPAHLNIYFELKTFLYNSWDIVLYGKWPYEVQIQFMYLSVSIYISIYISVYLRYLCIYLSVYLLIYLSVYLLPVNPSASTLSASTCLSATPSFDYHPSLGGVCLATLSQGRPAEWWMEQVFELGDEWRAKVFFIHPGPVIPSYHAFHKLFLSVSLSSSPSWCQCFHYVVAGLKGEHAQLPTFISAVRPVWLVIFLAFKPGPGSWV